MRLPLFVAALTMLATSAIARADIVGDTIQGTFDSPTVTTLSANLGTFTAPGGGSLGTEFTYQITGSQVILTDIASTGLLDVPFTGFVFTDITKDPFITGVSLDAAASTITGGTASFTSDSLTFNFAGLAVHAGDKAVYDITYAPTSVTPEPSSILLLGTGLLVFAGIIRRHLV